MSSVAVAAPIVRRPLRRRVERRLLAGVAGGIADWLNAPAAFVRVVVLLGMNASVWVLVGYAVAALALPARGQRLPGWDNLVGLGRFGMLYVAGFLASGPDVGVNELFDDEPELWIPLVGLLLAGAAAFFSATYRAEGERPPMDPRLSVLAAVPLAAFAALLAVGLLVASDLRWDRVLPLGVVVSGLGLLVASRSHRWRAYVAPAVLATAAAALAVAAEVRLQGGIGDRQVVAAGSGTSRVAIGDLSVDLAHLRNAREEVTYRASVGVGDLEIVVPDRRSVAVDLRVGRGQIYAIPHSESGLGVGIVDSDVRLGPRPRRAAARATTFRVIAEVGLGEITVTRSYARAGLP